MLCVKRTYAYVWKMRYIKYLVGDVASQKQNLWHDCNTLDTDYETVNFL